MKKIFTALVLLVCSVSLAHRDSDVDNLNECKLNKRSIEGSKEGSKLTVDCNDLYHLYKSQVSKNSRRASSFKMGAFNVFRLGSGNSRFKDYKLTANLLKIHDLVAVSEMDHSASEEFKSNANLLKHPNLDFKKLYLKPGYLKLLLELRKTNPAWSLIISPAGQSNDEELMGFYYRADRVQLENSSYCKAYNKKLRSKKNLIFSGGNNGPKFKRAPVSPHLNKSFGCLLGIEKEENDIFRVPFSARFKVGSGFDFQMLAYHARYQPPIAIGAACGFECLEKVNSFLNTTFHRNGRFLKVLNREALSFLKKHMEFISLAKDEASALDEEYGSVIKFRTARPRIYNFLMEAKAVLKKAVPETVNKVWKKSYSQTITKTDKDRIVRSMVRLFSETEAYPEFKTFIFEKGKIHRAFLKDIVKAGVFGETFKRYSIWTGPEKIARFNEVALVLKEMEKIAELEKDKDVVLGGDLNLEEGSNSYYWGFFKDNYDYSTVAIGSPTSIGETHGLDKAFDHFMYDAKNSLEECQPLEANVVDFVNNKSYWKGFEGYFVRSRSGIEKMSKIQYERISKIKYVGTRGEVSSTKEIMVSSGYTSCWDGQLYKPASRADIWKNAFECKTLNTYLIGGRNRHRLFTDLISDHLPINMKCSKTADLD